MMMYFGSGAGLDRAQHDNEARVILPDHLPEFLNGAVHRGLSRDESFFPEIPHHGLKVAVVNKATYVYVTSINIGV